MKKILIKILTMVFIPSIMGCTNKLTKNIKNIDAVYGENNIIPYGGNVERKQCFLNLTYTDGSVESLSGDDVNVEVASGSSFSKKEMEIKISSSKDKNISKSIKITPKERDSLKVLFIGNSFSDDTIEWMHNISEELGVTLLAENMYIGSCDIATHFNNIINDAKAYEWVRRQGIYWNRTECVSLKDRIEAEDWDYISFQQASGLSGVEQSYYYLPYLLDEVEKLLPNKEHTQFVFNMTWAYQNDSSHWDFYRYNNNQLTMYNAIVNCMKTQVLTSNKIGAIIPNGTAVQNARTSYIMDNLTRDGYHLSFDLGRYIVGLNAIRTLTGKEINNLNFSTVDESRTLIAKESVNNAQKDNLAITNSIYVDNPYSLDDLEANYDLLDINFERGYFDSSSSNPSNRIYSSTNDFSKRFMSSQIFASDELPNGAVIYIKSGYRYRPDGWHSLNSKSGIRPEATNNDFTKIDDNWKKDFSYRAFNICRNDDAIMSDEEITSIQNGEIFKIFVKK